MKRVFGMLTVMLFILVTIGTSDGATLVRTSGVAMPEDRIPEAGFLFDPSLGVLTSVDISLSGPFDRQYETQESLPYGAISTPIMANINVNIEMRYHDDSTVSDVSYNLEGEAEGGIERPTPESDDESAAWVTGTMDFYPNNPTIHITDPWELDLFTLEGEVEVEELRIYGDLTFYSGSSILDEFGNSYQGELDDYLVLSSGSVIATYTYVPIPSALWLLGSGLIGLVGFRKKFKKA